MKQWVKSSKPCVKLLAILSLSSWLLACQPQAPVYPELIAAEVACNRAYDNAIDTGRCDDYLPHVTDCPAYQEAEKYCKLLFDVAEEAR